MGKVEGASELIIEYTEEQRILHELTKYETAMWAFELQCKRSTERSYQCADIIINTMEDHPREDIVLACRKLFLDDCRDMNEIWAVHKNKYNECIRKLREFREKNNGRK